MNLWRSTDAREPGALCQRPDHPSKAYRPDIQILRAVAVILVLLFHLQVPGFSAGFLGVDIFFVISGYLMQTLYGNGVGAAEFYRRRARRLLPVYFGLIIAVLVVSAVVTLPSEFGDVAEQSLFASVLASNIGYWLQVSYFENSHFRPLLHLWSLGVEAQFYLIFPLLLWFRRPWLVASAALSLLACLAAVTVSPNFAFFMLPFRFWEFALGMLVAGWALQDRRIGALAVAGMILCLAIPVSGQAASMFTGHPALPAVIIALLTALALVSRLPTQFEASLAGRAAQKIGDVSYSLYLAHFPVIVLLNYEPFGGTRLGLHPWTLPLVALATFVLYFGLERPGPRLFSVRGSTAAVLAIWLLALTFPKAQILRFDQRDRLIFAAPEDRDIFRCGKLFRLTHPRQSFCPLGKGAPVLLVGDSHADSLKASFARVAERHGRGAHLNVANALLLDPSSLPQWLRQEADRLGARFVFLHFKQDYLSPELIESVRRALGDRLVVITPVVEFTDSVPKLMYRREALRPLPPNSKLIAYLEANPEIPTISATIPPERDGVPLYFDANHLTLTGARMLEPRFEAFFQAAEGRKSAPEGRPL